MGGCFGWFKDPKKNVVNHLDDDSIDGASIINFHKENPWRKHGIRDTVHRTNPLALAELEELEIQNQLLTGKDFKKKKEGEKPVKVVALTKTRHISKASSLLSKKLEAKKGIKNKRTTPMSEKSTPGKSPVKKSPGFKSIKRRRKKKSPSTSGTESVTSTAPNATVSPIQIETIKPKIQDHENNNKKSPSTSETESITSTAPNATVPLIQIETIKPTIQDHEINNKKSPSTSETESITSTAPNATVSPIQIETIKPKIQDHENNNVNKTQKLKQHSSSISVVSSVESNVDINSNVEKRRDSQLSKLADDDDNNNNDNNNKKPKLIQKLHHKLLSNNTPVSTIVARAEAESNEQVNLLSEDQTFTETPKKPAVTKPLAVNSKSSTKSISLKSQSSGLSISLGKDTSVSSSSKLKRSVPHHRKTKSHKNKHRKRGKKKRKKKSHPSAVAVHKKHGKVANSERSKGTKSRRIKSRSFYLTDPRTHAIIEFELKNTKTQQNNLIEWETKQKATTTHFCGCRKNNNKFNWDNQPHPCYMESTQQEFDNNQIEETSCLGAQAEVLISNSYLNLFNNVSEHCIQTCSDEGMDADDELSSYSNQNHQSSKRKVKKKKRTNFSRKC